MMREETLDMACINYVSSDLVILTVFLPSCSCKWFDDPKTHLGSYFQKRLSVKFIVVKPSFFCIPRDVVSTWSSGTGE